MRHTRALLTGVLALGLAALGCEDTATDPATGLEANRGNGNGARAGPNVVRVAAQDQEFVTSHQEIGSGWTTFRFQNRSHAPHFLIIERMPVVDGDQKTVEDSKAEVVPVFQAGMDLIREGDVPAALAEFGNLPGWYFQVDFVGGPGLTSPGETSETRVHLEPGTYVIECYVKTADGVFHSTHGMIEGLTVTERGNAAGAPPRTSGRVTIDLGAATFGGTGMSFDDSITRPGVQTLEVYFEDQVGADAPYAHFLGHDVHLVRLEEGADLGALETWMNWSLPGGLAGHAPTGVTFLGGVQDMPGGSTAYVRANLRPGDYAWIAEVPEPGDEHMLVQFSVP